VQKLQGLGELKRDFTADYITDMIACQVTVLIMYDERAPQVCGRKQMAAGEGGHPDCCLGRTPRDPACRLTAKATHLGAGWLRASGRQLAG